MNSASDPDEIEATNAYNNKSFITETQNRRLWPDDSTRAPDSPAGFSTF